MSVSSWFQPTLGYSEFFLSKALQSLGHEVHIATSDRYFRFPDYEHTVGPLLGPRVLSPGSGIECGLPVTRLPVYFEYRRHLVLRGLRDVMRRFAPDAVITYQAFQFPVIQCALAKARLPFVLSVRSSMEREVFEKQDLPRRLFYAAIKRAVAPMMRRRVDMFSALSAGGRAIVAEVFGISRDAVRLVPLGADTTRFVHCPSARRTRRHSLGVGDETLVICYAGKLIPGKDVHVLARAFASMRHNGDSRLLLVGQGAPQYVDQLRAIAGDRLIVVPPVSNDRLPEFFSAADIGVWPSESSNAAVEAAATGLPLVVSRTKATDSYIEADNGLSFERGDHVALAQCLEVLANDPRRRRAMGQRGRTHVEAVFSWRAIARQEAELLQRLRHCRLRDAAHTTAG